MTIIQALILGILQGATEFIPVSSSGHLVIAPYLLGWQIEPKEAFVFDVLLQFATLVAVLIYFRRELFSILIGLINGLKERAPFRTPDARLGWLLLLSTIPAGITALLFKETFERAFNNPRAAALFLLGTSTFLLIAELAKNRERSLKQLTWIDAFVIGLFQVFALFPGISRSGSTISGGMFRGLQRKAAARFSFLMSVPVLTASGTLAVYDLIQNPGLVAQVPVYMVGFLSAGVVGYAAIRWLLGYLSSRSLYPFAIYCLILGCISLVLMVFN